MKKFIVLIVIFFLSQKHSWPFDQHNVDSLLQALKTATEDTTRVNNLFNLSSSYLGNDPEKATDYANQSLALAEKIRYKKGIGNAYQILGDIENYKGNYTLSIEFLKKALNIFEEIGFKSGIAKAYNNFANSYNDLGNYEEALKNYFESLRIKKEIGDSLGMSKTYSNIGNVYAKQGNFPEALKMQFAALKINEKIQNKSGMAKCFNNIGNIYKDQQNYTEALHYFSANLKLEKELNDKQGIAVHFINVGNIRHAQGNYQEALTNYFAARNIFKEIGSKIGIAHSNINISSVYNSQGANYPDSKKFAFEALKIYEETGDREGIAISNIIIGDIFKNERNYPQAASRITRGLAIAKEIGSLYYIRQAFYNLSSLDSARGNFRNAFEHYKMYNTYHDSMVNEENTKKQVQFEMQYEFDKKEALTTAEQEKKDALSTAEIKRQKLILNTTLGGVGITGIFSFLLISSIGRRRKTTFEKQVSQVEMKALRSQMNPHFIFNSLQSINKYMLDNDKQNASDFLSKFSKVMRLILENSREQEVPLEQDLAALELYIQLEALRFQNRFTYQIEIDPEIDRETTLIPPMILQPFVENSIIHGLRTKDDGMIRIKIYKENNMIRCTVEDNGVGREQSVKIETGEEKKHESLAMKITQERLNIISKLKKVNAAMNIFDLKNAENKPGGLRVELFLPYETAF